MPDQFFADYISELPESLQDMVEQLAEDPTTPFECVHGEKTPAVGIYYVPLGCVALPGVEVQPICAQHHHSDGSFEGMEPIVDLSVDGKWSADTGEQPLFKIMRTPETGALALMLCDIEEPPEESLST